MQGQNAAPGARPAAAPAPSVLVERPIGLQRGREPGPAWLIALFGAAAVVIAVGFYVRKLRARRPKT